jgi:hypothetical protein
MKNWIEKNYKTLIIAAFLIPILTVAVVSISHVTEWYGLSNPISWAVYLSIGIEIAALSALAAISANMGSKVYFPFAIVTIVQFIGNIFFAYSYIDINTKQFKDWVDLVSPFVEFMGVDPNDPIGHKRFLAFFAGGMLPLISLSFLHMLIKFTEEDRMKNVESGVDEKLINKIDAKDIISEVSKIRLSDEDMSILEKHLMNPNPPNEALVKAAENYKETQKEALIEMMKYDQELGLYDEPYENPLVKEPSVTPQNAEEMMSTTNSNIIESIPSDDEVSDWDVTLMDGLEDEEPFFTEEETENIFQEEPTEEEIIGNFSTINPETGNIFQDNEYVPSLSDEEIMKLNQDEYERKLSDDDSWSEELEEQFQNEQVPEPFATPEEVEKFGIDVKVINDTLDEVNNEIDKEEGEVPKFDLEMVNDEPVYQSQQKEIDEANEILENLEPMEILEPTPLEIVEPTSEDEGIKKKS